MAKREAKKVGKAKKGASPRRVYSAETVAKLMSKDISTIYRYVDEGHLRKLPAFPPTAKRPPVRFDADYIDALLVEYGIGQEATIVA